MIVIALTENGAIISATNKEVSEILHSATGDIPNEIKIGQRIPAIDYAASITKIRNLEADYTYRSLCNSARDFSASLDSLKKAITDASQLGV